MMEKTICLLCDEPAERRGYISPDQKPNTAAGWKYDCSGDCPPYALQGGTHHHIEVFIKDEEKRAIIANFLKEKYNSRGYEEPYFEIFFDDLCKLGLVK
jgi:hypothetical protein